MARRRRREEKERRRGAWLEDGKASAPSAPNHGFNRRDDCQTHRFHLCLVSLPVACSYTLKFRSFYNSVRAPPEGFFLTIWSPVEGHAIKLCTWLQSPKEWHNFVSWLWRGRHSY